MDVTSLSARQNLARQSKIDRLAGTHRPELYISRTHRTESPKPDKSQEGSTTRSQGAVPSMMITVLAFVLVIHITPSFQAPYVVPFNTPANTSFPCQANARVAVGPVVHKPPVNVRKYIESKSQWSLEGIDHSDPSFRHAAAPSDHE